MHVWALLLFLTSRKIRRRKLLLFYIIFHKKCEFRQRLSILRENTTFRKLSHKFYFILYSVFSVETDFYKQACFSSWLRTYSENPQEPARSYSVRPPFIFLQLLPTTYNDGLPDHPFQLLLKARTGYLKSVIDIILGVPLLVSGHQDTPHTSIPKHQCHTTLSVASDTF